MIYMSKIKTLNDKYTLQDYLFEIYSHMTLNKYWKVKEGYLFDVKIPVKKFLMQAGKRIGSATWH